MLGSETSDGENIAGERYCGEGCLREGLSEEVAIKQRGSGEKVASMGQEQHVPRP